MATLPRPLRGPIVPEQTVSAVEGHGEEACEEVSEVVEPASSAGSEEGEKTAQLDHTLFSNKLWNLADNMGGRTAVDIAADLEDLMKLKMH